MFCTRDFLALNRYISVKATCKNTPNIMVATISRILICSSPYGYIKMIKTAFKLFWQFLIYTRNTEFRWLVGKSRLNMRNISYLSVQSVLSSRLLSEHLKIKIYKNTVSPVVLYGFETWSITLTEEYSLRMFEDMVLRRRFGPKREEVARLEKTEKWGAS